MREQVGVALSTRLGRCTMCAAAVVCWTGVVVCLPRARGISLIAGRWFELPFSLHDPLLDLFLYSAVAFTLLAWWGWAAAGPRTRRWDEAEVWHESEYWDEDGQPIEPSH